MRRVALRIGGLFQRLALLGNPDRQRAGPHPPFRIRIAPPSTRATTWRIDKTRSQRPSRAASTLLSRAAHAVERCGPGALESREAPHEPLPHHGRSHGSGPCSASMRRAPRFCARARTKIEHLLAGPCQGKGGGKLRAFILNFDKALDIGGLAASAGPRPSVSKANVSRQRNKALAQRADVRDQQAPSRVSP